MYQKIDKMIKALEIRGRSKSTIKNMVLTMKDFSRFYNQTPYIDIKSKAGTLQLNVSLRDYKTDIYYYVKGNIIVDDWDEICREKTDIEMLSIEMGLKKEDTKSIVDVLCNDCLKNYKAEDVVMFNPMGMAVFDIALGN